MTAPESPRAAIERHSKSFALASRLLPRQASDDAAVVYAWCRRADDAIDESGAEPAAYALVRLRRELAELYAGAATGDPVLSAFQRVVHDTGIPWQYPAELLAGMEMDVAGHHYARLEDLLVYCYRVASTVGLMMCHVMGVNDPSALRPAAHLGLAMQLTNICRDVNEDHRRGRVYLPEELLIRHGAPLLRAEVGRAFPSQAVAAARGVVRDLSEIAERYYASSDDGLDHLSFRCALGVNAARRIYSAIGCQLERQGFDVLSPRAVVPLSSKLWLCAQALGSTLTRRLGALPRRFQAVPLRTVQHGTDLISL